VKIFKLRSVEVGAEVKIRQVDRAKESVVRDDRVEKVINAG
jgi:hypothetical protein